MIPCHRRSRVELSYFSSIYMAMIHVYMVQRQLHEERAQHACSIPVYITAVVCNMHTEHQQ